MTGVVEQPNVFVSRFEEFAKTGAGAPWLARIREQAIERFATLGFPTTREEEWRFTSVAPIARTAFEPAVPDGRGVRAADLERLLFTAPNLVQLVFVNGRYASGLSRIALPRGVAAGSLAEALQGGSAEVEQHLARYAAFDQHAFAALNTAFLEDGAFVRIPKGTVLETPLHLIFISTTAAAPSVTHPRNLVLAERDSQATLIETYIGIGEQVTFTNAVTEIVAGENAVIDHYKLQLEPVNSFHVAMLQVQAGRSGNVSSHLVSIGGALVRQDSGIVLSEGTEATLNGLYLVSGDQHVDNHTAIDHAKPHGTSHEVFKGILDGRSSAVFNGRILVRPDAQKTDSKQTNKNLVLSEEAVINTKPELQIFADDVRCTHGATIGQLDAEALFYLQSRGIGRSEARDLLVLAFARDIIDRIKVEPMRHRLEQILFERLHVNRQ